MKPPRRLKPKPEAVEAARQRLAEGTQPGSEKTSGVTITIEGHHRIATELQERHAADASARAREVLDALFALHGLEAMLTRIGGFMNPTDQQTLTRARAVLREHGFREKRTQDWVDRVPDSTVEK